MIVDTQFQVYNIVIGHVSVCNLGSDPISLACIDTIHSYHDIIVCPLHPSLWLFLQRKISPPQPLPFFPPAWRPSVCSPWVCLFCLFTYFVCRTHEWVNSRSICLCLILPSVTPSGSIPVVNGKISFSLRLSSSPPCVHTTLSVHLLTDAQVASEMLQWTERLHMSFRISVSDFHVFWRTFTSFSIVATLVYVLTSSARGFPFPHVLANTCCWSIHWWQPFWPGRGDSSSWF